MLTFLNKFHEKLLKSLHKKTICFKVTLLCIGIGLFITQVLKSFNNVFFTSMKTFTEF